jgi:hypothetical protein
LTFVVVVGKPCEMKKEKPHAYTKKRKDYRANEDTEGRKEGFRRKKEEYRRRVGRISREGRKDIEGRKEGRLPKEKEGRKDGRTDGRKTKTGSRAASGINSYPPNPNHCGWLLIIQILGI